MAGLIVNKPMSKWLYCLFVHCTQKQQVFHNKLNFHLKEGILMGYIHVGHRVKEHRDSDKRNPLSQEKAK